MEKHVRGDLVTLSPEWPVWGRVFTVSYPRPTQVVLASLAATERGRRFQAKPLRATDFPGERGRWNLHPGRLPVLGMHARPHRRRLR
jgi:hypothetical protein